MAIPAFEQQHGRIGLLDDGRTGMLFAPRDAEDLARVLERLLGDAGLRRTLGEAARRHIAARFTVETMTDRFLEATSR